MEGSQPQLAVKPSVSKLLAHIRCAIVSQPQLAVKPSVSDVDASIGQDYMSQPQLAVKPSVRLVFFYPYISGSARGFFPGGG